MALDTLVAGLVFLLKIMGADDTVKKVLIELAPTQSAMNMGASFGSGLYELWFTDTGMYATLFALATIYVFVRVIMFRDEMKELLDRFGLPYFDIGDHRLMGLNLFSGVKSKLSPTVGMVAEWLVNSIFMPIIYMSFAWLSSKAALMLLFNKGAISAFIDAMFDNPILTIMHVQTAITFVAIFFEVSMLIMWAGIYFYPFLEAARIFDKGIGEPLLAIFHVNFFVIPGMIALFDLGLVLSNANHGFTAEAVYVLALLLGPILYFGGAWWAHTKTGAKVAAQLILFKVAAAKIPAGILQAASAARIVSANQQGELSTDYEEVTNKFKKPNV